MRAFDQRYVIADLVRVHTVETVPVHAVADREAHGRDTLFTRGEHAVPVLHGAKLADPKRVHVEIALIVQIRQRVVRYVEAEAKLVNEALVESVNPLRREICYVGRRENREIWVDRIVVVFGTVHGDPAENAVGGPEIVIHAPEILVGADRSFDGLARGEIERVDLLEIGVGQELVNDGLGPRMNAVGGNDVVGKRRSRVGVENNDWRTDDLAGSRIDRRFQQLREIAGSENIFGKPGRLNTGHYFPPAFIIEGPECLILDQWTADHHSELISPKLVLRRPGGQAQIEKVILGVEVVVL